MSTAGFLEALEHKKQEFNVQKLKFKKLQ